MKQIIIRIDESVNLQNIAYTVLEDMAMDVLESYDINLEDPTNIVGLQIQLQTNLNSEFGIEYQVKYKDGELFISQMEQQEDTTMANQILQNELAVAKKLLSLRYEELETLRKQNQMLKESRQEIRRQLYKNIAESYQSDHPSQVNWKVIEES